MRVALVDDDTHHRRTLEVLLRHTPGFSVAGSFGDPAAALAAGEARRSWEVALVAIDLPAPGGVEVTRQLKARHPARGVLVMVAHEDPDALLTAIRAGADGYLHKRTPAPELLAAVRGAAAGAAPLTAPVARSVLALVEPAPAAGADLELTSLERALLRCLGDGHGYHEAAAALGVRLDAVRGHVRGLYRKLHAQAA